MLLNMFQTKKSKALKGAFCFFVQTEEYGIMHIV